MRKRLIIFLSVIPFILSCAAQYTPPPQRSNNNFSTVIHQNYDLVWAAVIDHLSSAFFAIDNFEKNSGLVTVSFGASNPEEFVDCGQWKRGQFEGPYVQFVRQAYQASLSGKMNISVRRIAEDETEVRVNARYILTVPPGDIGTSADMWVFDSGSYSTIPVTNPALGTSTDRTCRPTYKAETSILEAVKSILESTGQQN